MYLFFSIETNGMIKNHSLTMDEVDNYPRIIALSYVLTNLEGKVIESFVSLIKPEGWEVPRFKFFVDNGLTTEICDKNGVKIKNAMAKFNAALNKASYKVAHNIAFDDPVIGAEMIRLGYDVEPYKNKPSFCTMLNTINWCDLRFPDGNGHRLPMLDDLHNKIFGTDIKLNYNGKYDINALVGCFFELKRRGVITLN